MLDEKRKRDHVHIAGVMRRASPSKLWTIDTTSLSQLSIEDTRKRIGIGSLDPRLNYRSDFTMKEDIEISEDASHTDSFPEKPPSKELGMRPPTKRMSFSIPNYVNWHEYKDDGERFGRTDVKIDFLTSVKNQYNCMACGSFASIASIESNFIIQTMLKHKKEAFDVDIFNVLKTIDLSEWQLFLDALILTAKQMPLNPNKDVTDVPPVIENIFNVASQRGVFFETTYPYKPQELEYQFTKFGQTTQKICPVTPPVKIIVKQISDADFRNEQLPDISGTQQIKIQTNPVFQMGNGARIILPGGRIHSLSMLKEWLWHQGPVVGIMPIRNDFINYYDDGVYDGTEWVVNEKEGLTDDIVKELNGFLNGTEWASLHAVCIVGYKDGPIKTEEIKDNENKPEVPYLICKNSWGRCWGRCGWFNVSQDYFVIKDRSGPTDILRYPVFVTQIDTTLIPDKCLVNNVTPCEAFLSGSSYTFDENCISIPPHLIDKEC